MIQGNKSSKRPACLNSFFSTFGDSYDITICAILASTSQQRPTLLIELALLFMVFVWALNFSVVKYSLSDIDPLSFNAFRFLLATAFIWTVVWARRIRIRIHKGDWPKLILLGLWGNLIYQLLFIYGIDRTFSANAAVMLGTIPVWTALLSHVFFEDKLTKITGIGVVLAFSGVALIMGGGPQGLSLSAETVSGDLIIVLSAMVFASYSLFSKPLLKKYTPIELSTIIMTIGAGSLILIALPSLFRLDYGSVSALSYIGVIYSGVLSIGLAYIIWNYGIQQVGPVRTATYQNLVPVLGLLLGFLLLGEQLTYVQYLGAGSVVGGIVLARL